MPSPQIIYLEADDEIQSVIDRMRKIHGPEVVFVVPRGARLLQNLTNLKHIAHQGQELHKQVRLVTDDRMGRSLASQVGITTFGSLDELQGTRPRVIPIDVLGPSPLRSARRLVPDEEPPASQPEAGPPPPPKRSRRKKLLPPLALPGWLRSGKAPWIVGGVLALLLLPLFLFVLPSATIHLTPKADPLQLERDVVVDASATEISEGPPSVIPGKAGERVVEGSTTADATGKKDVGSKASGTVSVKNCEDSSSHTLPAGSTLRSAGLSFTTNAATTLPPAVVAGGVVTCGSSSVGITAAAPGGGYNLTNATFTVPLSGNFSATGSTTGGSTREVTVVAAADVEAAKTKLTEELKKEAKGALSEALGDVRLIDEALQVSVVSSTPTPAVGAEGSTVTLQLKLQVKGLGFKETDLRQALRDSARSSIGEDREIMMEEEEQADIEVTRSDLAAGTINMHASLAAFSARRYQPGEVAGAVKGKTVKQAEDYFRREDAISEVKVSIWPSFKNRLPYFASRIKIKLETPKK